MESVAPRCVDDSRSAEPRVSVVIPCFKQEVFLFECLNSLLAQTMPDWEAFVVDDCSPGRIVDRIVGSYNDPRIRSIRHDTNLGLAASRNTGLQAGHAPFALCVDADDFLHPEFLAATLDAIERQGAACSYSDFQLVGLYNDVCRYEPKSAKELAEVQWIPGPGVTMRRSVWEKAGGYSADLHWNEDWDFWIAVMHLGFSFARVPRPLYFYRRHVDTMTATRSRMSEWMTREVILKKRAEFFAVGDRAKKFRIGGLLRSAYANRMAGHRWQSIILTARAILVDPTLLFSETKTAVRGLARRIKRKVQSLMRKASQIRSPPCKKEINLPPLDWETQAPILHYRYGHLSHDFPVLGHVIDKTRACSVLEIGCGSGRLVPVYLTHNVQTIWLQDVSERALDLCRQRFFCQKHIRYFHGNVQSIPISAAPDLIVANRVLQHILKDDKFKGIMNYLTSIARYFYINEAGIEEAKSINWPYLKGRDYIQVFCDLGYHLVEQDELMADSGRQRWMLFAK
jgi:glycosyltransferase involved in cell wall biosynthesis/SAM-dependent methyltransferase